MKMTRPQSPPRSDPEKRKSKFHLLDVEELHNRIVYYQFYRDYLTRYIKKMLNKKPSLIICRYLSSASRKKIRTVKRIHILYKYFNQLYFSKKIKSLFKKQIDNPPEFYDVEQLPNIENFEKRCSFVNTNK
jgi:hypothetical protein